MGNFFKNAVIHWKTSLAGFASGLFAAMLLGFQNGQFQLNLKSAGAFFLLTVAGMLQKDADKSNALNPQVAATITNCILVLFMLGSLLAPQSASAQMLSTSHARGSSSWLANTLANDAGPDSIILVSGSGVKFDTMTAPFPIELSITQYQTIAGERIPIAPIYFEDCQVTAVSGDTLVVGTRAQNGTVRRAWGPGTKIEVGPYVSYVKQYQDSLTAKTLGLVSYSSAKADSSTTGQALTSSGLTFAVGANQVWQFEVAIYDSSSSSAGVKFGYAIPSGATIASLGWGQTTGATAMTTDIIAATATAGTAVTTAAGYGSYKAAGTVTTSSTTGNVVFEYLKATSGTAIIKAGSLIRAYRVQ